MNGNGQTRNTSTRRNVVSGTGPKPVKPTTPSAASNGADFIVAGMFDFEIGQDIALVKKILTAKPNCQGGMQ